MPENSKYTTKQMKNKWVDTAINLCDKTPRNLAIGFT